MHVSLIQMSKTEIIFLNHAIWKGKLNGIISIDV